MENKASNTPVCLGITAFCACKHNVKNKEGQKNSEHSDKLQKGRSRNKAIFFFPYRLNECSKHHANTQEITDVGEMDVEIPADQVHVVEDSKACHDAYKAKGNVDGLIN